MRRVVRVRELDRAPGGAQEVHEGVLLAHPSDIYVGGEEGFAAYELQLRIGEG